MSVEDSRRIWYYQHTFMKRYTTIHPLFMSFYSKSLYRDVGRNWRKTSFLYLFLLLAICLIPIMFKLRSFVSDFLISEAPKFVKQVPVITIAKGKVSVDAQMPYIIKDPATNTPFIIIDTTGRITSFNGSDARALLTDTKLIIRKGPEQIRAFDLSQIDSLMIDQSTIYQWLETFSEYFVFVLYPFALFFSFLLRIIQALIFALIGIFFAKTMKVSLPYPSLVSLATVSMTPAIILNTLYDSIDTTIPLWWLINSLFALAYLRFAVKSNSEPEKADLKS